MNNKNLYIFIDESGNFDFSPSGTRYFALTAISTTSPINGRDGLLDYRYKLLCCGDDEEYFHATEDKQEIRDGFYSLICNFDDYFIDSIVAQKNKVNPSLFVETYQKKGKELSKITGAEFYRIICQTLLQYIFRRFEASDINQIIVILDALFTDSKRQMILKSLKSYLRQNFKKQFYIYFHQSKADVNCQIADYCGWAIYVKNERKESRPHDQVKDKIKSEFLIFQRGQTEYYQYKK